jgi:glycosyltransferase involved in cell wall biosynthesis
MSKILGIDASTVGSGGGRRHLIELLKNFKKDEYGFESIKVWGVDSLLNELPNSPSIIKITHPFLNRGLFYRYIWQLFIRDKSISMECDILFSPFGNYTGKFRPYVSMCRNMLIFDKSERKRFGISWLRLKMKILNYVQRKSFANSQGIIFLSQFAVDKVGVVINLSIINHKIIHHGVSKSFYNVPKTQLDISSYTNLNPYKILYVSSILEYKHPWNLVKAIYNLRKANYKLSLDIVGNVDQKSSGIKLKNSIIQYDSKGEFITWHEKIGLDKVSDFYKNSNLFVFASTCENMPNILIEAMSAGLPILCSNYPPMPEFLKDGGFYMNPTNIEDLQNNLQLLIDDKELRAKLALISNSYSNTYTWENCSKHTFSFLTNTLNNYIQND